MDDLRDLFVANRTQARLVSYAGSPPRLQRRQSPVRGTNSRQSHQLLIHNPGLGKMFFGYRLQGCCPGGDRFAGKDSSLARKTLIRGGQRNCQFEVAPKVRERLGCPIDLVLRHPAVDSRVDW